MKTELRRRADHLAAAYGEQLPLPLTGTPLGRDQYIRLHREIFNEALGAPAGAEIRELCRQLLTPDEDMP